MKTKTDPRHQKRVKVVQELFSLSFHDQKTQHKTTTEVTKVKDQLNTHIQKAAPEWPIEKIAKIDLAILQLGTHELLFDKKQPPKVIIDEAVEIAKEFGGEKSSAFVNGVLATILKNNT